MSHAADAAPIKKPFWSPGTYVLLILGVLGLAAMAYRFLYGLGAATNLSNQYPWGIWKAISVAAAVALATGGFTTAALVHIFHRERYERLVRPALLVGLLGYTFGCASLFVDIGRYYNIWHPAWPTMWQGDSVLFEVAMCIMGYLTILYIEFIPILVERFSGRVSLPGLLRVLNRPSEVALSVSNRILGKVLSAFILVGVVLSCMHHSSLGALMLVAPYKMDPLWYTPVLPLLFLLSVFPVGFATLLAIAIPTDRALGRYPDMQTYAPLGRYIFVFQGVYLIAKFSDLLIRETFDLLWPLDSMAIMWWLEVGVGGVLPFVMLASRRVRRSPALLTTACVLLAGGLTLNRINVFLTAFQSAYNPVRYFPSMTEIALTAGLLAIFALLFRAMLTFFPIWPRQRALGGVRR